MRMIHIFNKLVLYVANLTERDEVRVVTTDRFTVINGDPRFDTQYVTIPAKSSAAEWIRPVYREGWSL